MLFLTLLAKEFKQKNNQKIKVIVIIIQAVYSYRQKNQHFLEGGGSLFSS